MLYNKNLKHNEPLCGFLGKSLPKINLLKRIIWHLYKQYDLEGKKEKALKKFKLKALSIYWLSH